jgi:ribose 5-phosphate isomerase RpiB
MKIAIASDYAGFSSKEEVREHVAKLGYEVNDQRAYNTVEAIEEQYMPSVAGTALSSVETTLLFWNIWRV